VTKELPFGEAIVSRYLSAGKPYFGFPISWFLNVIEVQSGLGGLERMTVRRIASNIAKLPVPLGTAGNSDWDFPEGGG
jgi:hypothetical protein